jgi:hypothetical protein
MRAVVVAIGLTVCCVGAVKSQPLSLLGGETVATGTTIRVAADAGACCTGEYHSLENDYLAQSFRAIAEKPISLLLDLANNLPGDVPAAPFRFNLFLARGSGGTGLGRVLWSSGPFAIPADLMGYHDYSFAISGVHLDVGQTYSWVLDTYSTRDGAQDVGAWLGNIGHDVAPYLDGDLYVRKATGQGWRSDRAAGWTNTGMDAAFLMQFATAVPEPETYAMWLLGIGALMYSVRRRRIEDTGKDRLHRGVPCPA